MEASTQSRPRTVGDTYGRTEGDGTVTFWRITEIRRDRYGLTVVSTGLPRMTMHKEAQRGA